MPINNNTVIVFDLETGGLDANTCEVLEIAAVALDPRTLTEVNYFQSYMKPLNVKNVHKEALKVNKITPEIMENAPERKVVWEQFGKWVKGFNRKGKGRSGIMPMPIPAGKNIRKFDLRIADRLCKDYGMVGEAGQPNLFNNRVTLDLEDFLFHWFEDTDDLPSYSMDDGVRPYFGLKTDGAHTALVDARQTALLIGKFIRLCRTLRTKKDRQGNPIINFANSCQGL